MKAVYINKYGSADQLKVGELEKPTPTNNEVLVKVHASAVNPVDWKMRQGMLKLVTGFNFPLKLGKDFSGEVVSSGSGVSRFKVGDKVWGQIPGTGGGAYAEFLVAEEKAMGIMPKNLNFQEAASIPLVGLTALQSLRSKAAVNEGDKVLINGASGGVGSLAVQIAVAIGADVTGVCSGENTEFVKSLGASHTINYKEQDFTQGKVQYDVILEFVGNVSFLKCKHALKKNGTYVTINPKPLSLPQGYIYSLLSNRKQKILFAKPSPKDLDFLKALVEAGQLKPIIDKSYPLENLAEAHRYSEKGHARGKIVVEIAHQG